MNLQKLIQTNANFRSKLVNMTALDISKKVSITLAEAKELQQYAALVAASKGE